MVVATMNTSPETRGKVILRAEEIAFAKVLAGNNKRLSDRALKKLRKWFTAKSARQIDFTDNDFLTIWKGLFYSMWMSDKMLVQEELSENISKLIHCFKKVNQAVSFVRCFFQTMVLEWFGIDQFRYDKFLMLVRRFLRQTFKLCQNQNWQEEVVTEVCKAFEQTVLSCPKGSARPPPLSLVMHFCEIYMQELAKIGKEEIPKKSVTAFLQPFIIHIGKQENKMVKRKIEENVFQYLLKQSDTAVEFREKFRAWKAAGCPGDSWEDMAKVEDVDVDNSEEEDDDDDDNDDEGKKEEIDEPEDDYEEMLDMEIPNEDKPLDPRAGRVNVELPHISFDAHSIAEALRQEVEKSDIAKSRTLLRKLSSQFTELSEGKYPLANKEGQIKRKLPKFKLRNVVDTAALRLSRFEQNQLKKGKKKLRKKKKKLDGDDSLEEDSKEAKDDQSPSQAIQKKKKKKKRKKLNGENIQETNSAGSVEIHSSPESSRKKIPVKMNGGDLQIVSRTKNPETQSPSQTSLKKKKKKNRLSGESIASPTERTESRTQTASPAKSSETLSPLQTSVKKKKNRLSGESIASPTERIESRTQTASPNSSETPSPLRTSVKKKKNRLSGESRASPTEKNESRTQTASPKSSETPSPLRTSVKKKKIRLSEEAIQKLNPTVNIEMLSLPQITHMLNQKMNGGDLQAASPSQTSPKTKKEKENLSREDIQGAMPTESAGAELPSQISRKKDNKTEMGVMQRVSPRKNLSQEKNLKKEHASPPSCSDNRGKKRKSEDSPMVRRNSIKRKKLYSIGQETTEVATETEKIVSTSPGISVTSSSNNNTPSSSKKVATPVGNKRVNIVLKKNSAQALKDYHLSVKRSPAIPFDALKQPGQGVLKPSPVGTRINPFYRLSKRKLLDS